jgi:hypothetical protein
MMLTAEIKTESRRVIDSVFSPLAKVASEALHEKVRPWEARSGRCRASLLDASALPPPARGRSITRHRARFAVW